MLHLLSAIVLFTFFIRDILLLSFFLAFFFQNLGITHNVITRWLRCLMVMPMAMLDSKLTFHSGSTREQIMHA